MNNRARWGDTKMFRIRPDMSIEMRWVQIDSGGGCSLQGSFFGWLGKSGEQPTAFRTEAEAVEVRNKALTSSIAALERKLAAQRKLAKSVGVAA